MRTDDPVEDGFVWIKSNDLVYARRVATNAFMHEILIEPSKSVNIETNLKALSSVWHYNLWPLKRYLVAVESDQISMDNLLDLIFALEGLFEKNASTDFIKMMVMLKIGASKTSARKLKATLDAAYRVRNDIAHGERSYDLFDYIKVQGEETLGQELYFDMKGIVNQMLILAISKLMSMPGMKNLRFTEEDFINDMFSK